MGIKELKEALEIIADNKDVADFEGEKPASLIDAGERALGVSFPSSYREFLKRLGCGDIWGEEIFGIINENFHSSTIPDAIWLTLKRRRDDRLPSQYVVVYDYGDGASAVINTETQGKDGENPICLWLPTSNPKDELEQVSSDFGIFLKDLIINAQP